LLREPKSLKQLVKKVLLCYITLAVIVRDRAFFERKKKKKGKTLFKLTCFRHCINNSQIKGDVIRLIDTMMNVENYLTQKTLYHTKRISQS